MIQGILLINISLLEKQRIANEIKFDIRDLNPAHEKMGNGVTLSVEELKKLRHVLNGTININD